MFLVELSDQFCVKTKYLQDSFFFLRIFLFGVIELPYGHVPLQLRKFGALLVAFD